MYTQCPDCATVFRVTADALRTAQGNVRCGVCSTSFNALENLSEEPFRATPEGEDAPAPEDTITVEEMPGNERHRTVDDCGSRPLAGFGDGSRGGRIGFRQRAVVRVRRQRRGPRSPVRQDVGDGPRGHGGHGAVGRPTLDARNQPGRDRGFAVGQRGRRFEAAAPRRRTSRPRSSSRPTNSRSWCSTNRTWTSSCPNPCRRLRRQPSPRGRGNLCRSRATCVRIPSRRRAS